MPTQIVVFYGLLFTIPPLCLLLYTRGKVSLTREELLNTPVARERVRTHPRDAATFARQCPLPRLTACPPPAWQRVQMLTEPGLEQEKRDQMDAVLFKTKGSMQTDWADKRQAQEGERQQKSGS